MKGNKLYRLKKELTTSHYLGVDL